MSFNACLVTDEPPVIEVAEPQPIATKSVGDSILCYCVTYARSLGAPLPRVGHARELQANSTPKEGGVVLFSYPKTDHAAYITSLDADGMWIEEANYKRCQRTKRWISYNDPFIRGFWYGGI